MGGKLDCLLLRVDARENLAQASFTGSTWILSLNPTAHSWVSSWASGSILGFQGRGEQCRGVCKAKPRPVCWHPLHLKTPRWLRTSNSLEAWCQCHTHGQRSTNERGLIPQLMENNYPLPSGEWALTDQGSPLSALKSAVEISHSSHENGVQKIAPTTPQKSPQDTGATQVFVKHPKSRQTSDSPPGAPHHHQTFFPQNLLSNLNLLLHAPFFEKRY